MSALKWLLQSRRRLLSAVAAAVLAVVGLSLFLHGGHRPVQAAPRPAPSHTAAPSPSRSSAAPAPGASPSAPSTQDYGQALDTARKFVTAWADHHAGSDRAWYAGAALYATDRLAQRLTTVDWHNVPATRVTGPLRLTDTGSAQLTEVAVPTDGGPVSLRLVPDGSSGWLVDSIAPGAQTEE